MENMENAIEVKDVKKSFKVFFDRGITFKDKILSRGRSRYEERQVLKGLSFCVEKGQAVGLIGKNGCGKSTTLKLLTKIIYPNEGTIEMKGRVSSLLELGAGFHPDMSGRENIYMNAAVFGLNRKEIEKRVSDIIEFSELEDFIENPVRTYSSGMYMRLAFSVAINVDADILLIDEILAVGDISFQKKCFQKLKDIKNNGTTIVIVSHSFDQIEKICDKSIWIEEGLVREEGIPQVVHRHYLDRMEESRINRLEEKQKYEENKINNVVEEQTKQAASPVQVESSEVSEDKLKILQIKQNKNLLEYLEDGVNRRGNRIVELTRINVVDINNVQNLVFRTGDSMSILIEFTAHEKGKKGTIGIGIYRDDGVYCFGTNTFIEQQKIMNLSEGKELLINFEELNLLPGKYHITVGMHDNIRADFYDQVDKAIPLEMVNLKGDLGICRMHSEWTFYERQNIEENIK